MLIVYWGVINYKCPISTSNFFLSIPALKLSQRPTTLPALVFELTLCMKTTAKSTNWPIRSHNSKKTISRWRKSTSKKSRNSSKNYSKNIKTSAPSTSNSSLSINNTINTSQKFSRFPPKSKSLSLKMPINNISNTNTNQLPQKTTLTIPPKDSSRKASR